MVWNAEQVKKFEKSKKEYDFPVVYFNFERNVEVTDGSLSQLEIFIYNLLTSEDLSKIKSGLANILYWGYARSGYRDYRVSQFLEGITDDQLSAFRDIIKKTKAPSLLQLKALGMPQFSGVSFLSKITAFLNPLERCILDLQIAKLKMPSGTRALDILTHGTGIQASRKNQEIYLALCSEFRCISEVYFDGKCRAVDIERGFFNLIQNHGVDCARTLYETA